MAEGLVLKGTMRAHTDMVTAIATPIDNSDMIVTASRDKSIIVWHLTKEEKTYGVARRRLTGHSHFVQDVVLSSDGQFALSGSWDSELRLWDLAEGKSARRFVGHTKDVLSVAFSIDNRQIVSASRDRTIKLWNTLGECKYTIQEGDAHTEWVSCVRFSPNTLQPTIVSASWDRTVKVWNLSNCKLRATLAGHTGYVNTVAVSPDGSLCASGGKDGVILLWDLAEGKRLYSLDAGAVIHALCFSPNRYWLCAATKKLQMGSNNKPETEETRKRIEENHEEEEEEEETEQDWGDWSEDDGGLESGFLCLFCDAEYSSCDTLFEHCRLSHCFDFHSVKTELRLDFYGSFKLINYIRSQVAENRCWICGLTCQSNQDLQNHLHEAYNLKETKLRWDKEKYLKPFMQDDKLLYSFGEDEVDEEDNDAELMRDVMNFENISVDDGSSKEKSATNNCTADEIGKVAAVSTLNGHPNMENSSEKMIVNGFDSREHIGAFDSKLEDKDSRVSLLKLSAKDIKKVNESYFGSYSSFGIHREMISDKVRTDSYRQAILENPSLMKGAVVMDIGCGTGILSLFAAQAGASRVIAVEASEKMAAVATQIAKDNDFWWDRPQSEGNINNAGKMEVVQGMVEELGESMQIQPHSVDVLVSEWMGYCLLYESMLSSVLFARDQWLKPGGAILPDTATMFVAGFGRGGTSLPFWENVYGFNMSCVGREVVRDAAGIPIVDVVDDHDLVTDSVVLQTFDLATMKHDEVDFTTSVELEPKLGDSTSNSTELRSTSTWCYGIVLWFDAGFTSRFCKEKPVVLSTSPYTPKTHWSQTIITFQEPIALALGNLGADGSAAVGTDACPARRIHLRVSIARGAVHRSIDISLETAGVGPDGQKRSWPAQIFNLS